MERRVGIEAVRLASRLCALVASPPASTITPTSLTKADASPVTVADFGAQAIISHLLAKHFPADPLVGEEDASELRRDLRLTTSSSVTNEGMHEKSIAAQIHELVNQVIGPSQGNLSMDMVLDAIDRGSATNGSGRRFWCLDPVDGTKGFLRGGQYAVCLALVDDKGIVQLGVMGCPNLPFTKGDNSSHTGVLFVAQRGQGVYQMPLFEDDTSIKESDRVSVSICTDPSQARFCESVEAAHSSQGNAARISHILGIQKPSVRMDSQCKYGILARGDVEIYLRLPAPHKDKVYVENIWDHATGSLFVTEAGGMVTDMHGQPLDFAHGRKLVRNQGVIASNHHAMHAKVIDAIKQIGLA